MTDYLNHLARMHVLVDAGTLNENPYYEIAFKLYPNLAFDLVVPQIARLIGVETAMRLSFFVAQLLVVTGAVALEFSVKARHEIAGYAALLTVHSMPFSLGLVNFELGMGVALWGMAAWIATRHSWPLRLAVHSAFVVVLFLAHFFALGVYGLTAGLYELRRLMAERASWQRVMSSLLMLAAPALVMLAALQVSGGAIGGSISEWKFGSKLAWVALFLNGYNVYLAAGSMAALVILLAYLAFKGQLGFVQGGPLIAAGLLITYLLMPFKLLDSRMADIRMITAMFVIVPAFLAFRPRQESGYVTGLVISAIIVFNAGYAAWVWLSYRTDYADLKASFALLRPASFVLVSSSGSGETGPTLLTDAPFDRAPVLAVHYARAFVSSFYTIAGMEPVEVRADLAHLDISTATETYRPPSLTTLQALAGGHDAVDAPGYLRHWTRDFHYVYLVGPRVEDPLPGILKEVATARRFTLYTVQR